VVILGGPAATLLDHLMSIGQIRLPRHEQIKHYAYIGQRAEGKLCPMHPDRIRRYSEDFARIREAFGRL
jgi:hypothetical protein